MEPQTEYTQQLSIIDYVVVSGQKSILEYIDNVENSVENPSKVKDGYFETPLEPGYGVKYSDEALTEYDYSNGRYWRSKKNGDSR